MRSWDDIPWNIIGVVPKDTFYRFIKILLRRLGVILFKKWKTQEGSVWHPVTSKILCKALILM